jgi:hypothetical protein
MWKDVPPAATLISSMLACGAVPPAVLAVADRFCGIACAFAGVYVTCPVDVQTVLCLKPLGSVRLYVIMMSLAPV